MLVARGGIEPPTYRFSGGRSYQLSYLAVVPSGRERAAARPGESTGAPPVRASEYAGQPRRRRAGRIVCRSGGQEPAICTGSRSDEGQ